ncbi:unnamed protein product [Pseudo-nitzschia multistriata]|uniref:MYND-type domain-containing protein n=1 Tax=Pseudo-nitzschia multistriata TaxID=183589 RepID=A0A448YY15_9STRA|nr:unnamed protein product [Pseudo-nitzschia multistriata]
MHLTTASTVTLTLYSDWHFCSGCGFPRAKDGKTAGKCAERETVNDVATKQEGAEQRRVCQKKLSICRRCKTAAYHDSECQRIHWKRGHRYDCNKLAKAIQPLKDIIASFEHHRDVTRGNRRPQRYWWDLLDPRDAAYSNRLWKESAVRWNRYGEYLEAMEGFQTALAQTGKMWNDHSVTIANNAHDTSHLEKTQDDKRSLSSSPVQDGDDGTDDDNSSISSGIHLARKLLFCAYCEADGNQIQSARSRLAQCVSILLEGCCSSSLLSPSDPNNRELQKRQQLQKTINPLLDDAWMELMLSYEEEKSPEVRRIARHVAHMAIQSSRRPGSLYRCEWKDPLQRPGYMAVLGTICDRNGTKLHPFQSSVMMQPYIPPEAHPSWCETLESNWETIAKELSELVAAGKASSKQRWAAVGSGDRGSGGDDHRVVSA